MGSFDSISNGKNNDIVSYDEFVRQLNNPEVIIADVLPRESYEKGHIPGTISLPLDEIPSKASEIIPDLDQELIVYCGSPT